MSRSNKATRRSGHSVRSNDIKPRRSRKFWLFTVGIVVVVAGTVYWWMESPQAYYASAREVLSRDPARCEQLAEQAIMKSGGNYPCAQLLQCQALAAMGEWDAALGGFSLIRDTSSCAGESLLDLGSAALQADQLQLAGRALQAARVRGQFFSRATELLVRLKLRLRLPDDALALCREWQAAAPDAPLAWAIAAEIEVSQFELSAAISDFRQALQSSPSGDLEKSLRASLANLLVLTGDVASARFQFDKLLESGPVTGKTQLDYIQLLRLEGRFHDALEEIERYLAKSAQSPEALKRRGQIRMDLGQWDLALSDLNSAVAGNEFDIATHHLLAQIYLRQGKRELAQPHLEKSRRLSDASLRISEIDELLRKDPSNAELTRERKSLEKGGSSTSSRE